MALTRLFSRQEKEKVRSLGKPTTTKLEPTEVRLEDGNRFDILNTIECSFTHGNIYQIYGTLVYIQNPYDDDVNFKVVPANSDYIQNIVGNYVNIKSHNKKKDAWEDNDLPTKYAAGLLSMDGYPHIRQLSGISRCPMMLEDGTIIKDNGYNEKTKLYFNIDENIDIRLMPLDEAKSWIDELLEEFPFVSPIDKSVAITYLLSAVMRATLDYCPLFGFSADTPGTGKTCLANLGGIIINGAEPPACNFNKKEEEFEKKLFSILVENRNILLIDNVEETFPVYSDTLCSMLTQKTYNGRILGLSKTQTVKTNTLFVMTGNKLTLVKDIVRRSLLCRLHSDDENPEKRVFKKEIFKWAKANRSDILSALISILHHNLTCEHSGNILDSFESWSKLVRSAVINAGYEDPVLSQQAIKDNDDGRQQMVYFLQALKETFGDKSFTAGEIKNGVKKVINGGTIEDDSLYDAFLEVYDGPVQDRDKLPPNNISRWLSKEQGKTYGGLQITSCPFLRNGSKTFQIKTITA